MTDSAMTFGLPLTKQHAPEWWRDDPGTHRRNGAHHVERDDTGWNAPDLSLLGSGRRAAPVFPEELLGPFWGPWTARKAHEASSAVDYVGVALLASAAATLGNVRWPIAGASWSEPPVLWCGLVGSPSSGKSPSMDAAFEVRREIGGSLRDAPAMDAACAVLVEAGLIRPRFTRAGETRGRASRNYEVNPALHGGIQ